MVEDDRMLGEALGRALRDAAHAVDWVQDGEAASTAVEACDYGAVLLDLSLPLKSGFEVLRRIRKNGNSVPVLIVTARDTLEERVAGLDCGADDYIVKPFEVEELLARLRAVVRRKAGTAFSILTNGVVALDPRTREAIVEGKNVPLSAREFSLLEALLLRPGTILSRRELEERIYGWNEEVESNAVEFLIHSVRRKLGARAIKNVRGLGWAVPKGNG
jgi:two-component system OmpR family response regulator